MGLPAIPLPAVPDRCAHAGGAARPSIGALLNELNVVLFDLSKSDMFVTFAGMQFDGASGFQFFTGRSPADSSLRSATRRSDDGADSSVRLIPAL
jgi:hypothetical protein